MGVQKVPVYCYQCVAGPDLLNVVVEDGVATTVEPNFAFAAEHPAGGRICVKAYGLVQKLYNPHRLTTPMRRTNPKKGKDEDPGWVPISWDEALDMLAAKLNAIRAAGLLDEHGYPRLAVTFGSAGIPVAYMGTLPAFLAAWGPVDQDIGSGQGVKCYHSEHLYGEYWHRAFTVAPDTPRCRLVISFGHNGDASGGVAGVWRHAEARARGLRWVQVEPHQSVTAATASEWVPIRPKTDAAVLFAMLHVVLHELPWQEVCDVPFLRHFTNAPYLVGPHGYYLRHGSSRRPLVWDPRQGQAVPFDTPGIEPALEGEFRVRGVEEGPDGHCWAHHAARCRPALALLREHVRDYTPEWAAEIADVPAATIRRLATEYVETAAVGETIDIEGTRLPYRPVAILLGKTVCNGWGGYECCWARTVLAALVGALEVPGSILGTTVRLNRPAVNRLESVRPGSDGFMAQPLNPTDRERWQARPRSRNAYQTLVPLVANSPWSPALGPAHLPWLFLEEPPEAWPPPTLPEVWIIYRTNPVISNWESDRLLRQLPRFPFIAAFAYTVDETNWFADLLLPESTDLESLQLYRIGGTKYIEQYWRYTGFALRQPVVPPRGDTRDLTDIATELAVRTGLLAAYNAAINRGAPLGVPLQSPLYDLRLDLERPYRAEEIWDRICRAATLSLTQGREEKDLAWFKAHGAFLVPFPERQWYLHPVMAASGLRYELPYQERLRRVGKELRARLHERGIRWWDAQLAEYQALPHWKDFPDLWAQVARRYGKDPNDYPLWLLTSRSMQYAWGSNVSLPLMAEVARHVQGHFGVMLHPQTAAAAGIREGDEVVLEAPHGAQARGKALLRQGVRPDVVVVLQQFGHWATPFAKELDMPTLNQLAIMDLTLTDATGSSADLVRVRVRRA
ncbi:MAG: formate dehydrogenase [Candidatus Tectimicrobiota bacterium]|nr:MAG: formate dehydrogenase [Candidatus Tectomicrobia bacterium]